eukprot:jgi/Mesen1/1374/ME000013S00870
MLILICIGQVQASPSTSRLASRPIAAREAGMACCLALCDLSAQLCKYAYTASNYSWTAGLSGTALLATELHPYALSKYGSSKHDTYNSMEELTRHQIFSHQSFSNSQSQGDSPYEQFHGCRERTHTTLDDAGKGICGAIDVDLAIHLSPTLEDDIEDW